MTQPAQPPTQSPAPPASPDTTTAADAVPSEEVTLIDQLRAIGVDLPDDFVLHRIVRAHLAKIPGGGVATWRQGEHAPWPRPPTQRQGEADEAFAVRQKSAKLYTVLLMFVVDGGVDAYCGPREGSAATASAVIHVRGEESTLEEVSPFGLAEALQEELLDEDDEEEEDDLLDEAREYMREWVDDIRAIRATANGINSAVRTPNEAVIRTALDEANLGFLSALETYAAAAVARRQEQEAADAELKAAEAALAAANGEANGANGKTHADVAQELLDAIEEDEELPAADDSALDG